MNGRSVTVSAGAADGDPPMSVVAFGTLRSGAELSGEAASPTEAFYFLLEESIPCGFFLHRSPFAGSEWDGGVLRIAARPAGRDGRASVRRPAGRVIRPCIDCARLIPSGSRCRRCAKARRLAKRGSTATQRRFRRRTLELTGGRCARCGRPAEEAHHVLPVGRGGDPEGPGKPLCRRCHRVEHEGYDGRHAEADRDGSREAGA
jgi:hypothetical protein